MTTGAIMRRLQLPILAGLTLLAADASAQQEALLVTRLGEDTIAVEHVTRDARTLRADVALRVPRASLTRYEVALDDAGRPTSMRVLEHDPAQGFDSEPTATETIELTGSGIPFIDMVHWPFELMVERTMAAPTDTVTLALTAGSRALPFRMESLGDGRYTATHPTRGTMTLEADAQGRLQTLDASRTTRAVRVQRAAPAQVAPIARAWAAQPPVGELSGRAETIETIDGADVTVDYGVPLKRGREIFGALVPYDRVWRTGANRATHFMTSRDLRAGETVIPAGTYTLFTIPGPERWTLIVNRRTDINGQAYDQAQDLARLEMPTRTLDQTVEPFTIMVEPTDEGGELRLRWDRTEAYLPFTVE